MPCFSPEMEVSSVFLPYPGSETDIVFGAYFYLAIAISFTGVLYYSCNFFAYLPSLGDNTFLEPAGVTLPVVL